MQILKWIGRSERERRRAISADERRRRDELFIPLEVGRLEDRRVLSNVAPTLTGSGGSLTTIQQSITDTANVGTSVSQLINSSNSTNDTGKYGIAITATSGNGTWQFSTNGTTWTTITGASNTNALLLDSGDLLRYEPGSTYTSTASITFRAWDESSGTIGNYVSTALNGGATAFSNTTTNSDITIQPNISLADIGDGSTESILDDQTIKPFNDGGAELSVTDQNNSDMLTLTLTQKVNGSVDTNLDAGTLGGVAYSENDGVYTISGLSQSQLNFDLGAFTFTPARQTAGSQATVSFDIGVTDSLSEGVSFPNATQFGLTGNVTPVLSGTFDFAGIPENSTSTTVDGTAISTLIAGHTTDSNDSSLGIAITNVDNANGQWEWSTDNSTWTNLSGESGTSAFLLANGDYLRFVPNANFVGTASITFLAWDGTSGTSHTLDDPTQSPGSGAFSTASATSSIQVYPVITVGGTGQTDSTGTPNPAPFSQATISDTDSTDMVTITIRQQLADGSTDTTFADGTLMSGVAFTSQSGGFYTLTDIPIAQAQADLEAITFASTASTPGSSQTTKFGIAVSDSFAPVNTAGDDNTVLVVNVPPTLTSVNNFASIAAETTSTPMTVADLIDATPSNSGAAVVGVDDTGGNWEYSTDGTHWVAIPKTVSTSEAFLLNSSDEVEFVSNTGGPATATLTLEAWDSANGGNADMLNSTASNPGLYSTTSGVVSIQVYPALSISGTGTTSTLDDETSNPFNSGSAHAAIGDSDSSDMLTITITQEQTGIGIDTALANGSLTSSDNYSGFVNNGNGTYSLEVVASDATTELRDLVFTPNPGPSGQTVDTTFQISVADGLAPTKSDSNTLLKVTSTSPPTLTSSNNLPAIPENTGGTYVDPGVAVSTLPISSLSSPGIAITAFDDSGGTWEYSTNGGLSWNAIPSVNGLTGTPPQVFLLASSDLIRFLPSSSPEFTGTATITYVAWNEDSGVAGHVANPTQRPLKGGLSTTTASASITVYPVLTIGGTQTIASLDDQTSKPFSTATVGDTLSTENVTVVITQQQGSGGSATTDTMLANGSLSLPLPIFGATFANNNDGTYTLTGTAALVQAELQALVFTPTLHEASDGSTVVTQFSIQVSDADAPLNTVTNSNSQLTVTATAPPVLNGANNLTPIPENVLVTADTGMLVSGLISGRTSDADGHPLGIAITSVDDSNGQWEYSTGSGWIPIYDAAAVPVGATSPYVAVSSTSALLLTPTDLVRFVPNANFFGSAAIQFQAWDQTVGVATAALDESFDPTALPGAGAFSTASATSTIQVVAPATVTVATPSQATNDETAISVFSSAFGTQPGVVDPNATLQIYTVTITQQLSGGATDATLANGSFTSASLATSGFVNNGNGTYTLTGVTAAQANTALAALVFTPTAHQVEPGLSVGTQFTITVNDGITTPTSNSSITLATTAVNDPPSFSVPSATYILPVLASNGATIGAAVATDIDKGSTITYSITGGNTGGAYAIDGNGNISVANNAALVFSSTPTVLTVTATNNGANGVAPASSTSTRTVALWEITASATPIAADSSTTLTVTLLTAGTVTVPASVNWGDNSTPSSITLSTAAPTQQLVHIYSANPNKANPSAPIPIDVLYTATGHQVETETTAQIAGAEIGIAFIPVTTSAFVEVVAPPTIQVAPTTAVVEQQVSQQVDTGVAPGQTTSGNERQVLLRIVSPTGDEESAIPVPNRDLNDLPDLFKKLPDGHYRVYLAEGGRQRLVLDVLVRQGRPVDTSEEAATAGDRPPTSQTESDGANGLADAAPQIRNPIPARRDEIRNSAGAPVPPNPAASDPPPSPIVAPAPMPLNPLAPNPAAPNPAPMPPLPGRGTPAAAVLPSGFSNRGFAAASPRSPSPFSAAWAEKWAAWTAAGVAAAAIVNGGDPQQSDALMERMSKRALSKSARRSRQLRKSTENDSDL